jgi:hypothetical protein
MTSPAIEVIVLSASTNETKKSGKTRKVTFLLPNDGPHPFEGMGGERFHIVCVRVNDDETPAVEPWVGCGECDLSFACYRGKTTCIREPDAEDAIKLFPRIDRSGPLEPPKQQQARRFMDLPFPQQAALRIKSEAFRRFLAETSGSHPVHDEESADRYVKHICDVASKADLKPGSYGAHEWLRLDAQFRDWMQEPVL